MKTLGSRKRIAKLKADKATKDKSLLASIYKLLGLKMSSTKSDAAIQKELASAQLAIKTKKVVKNGTSGYRERREDRPDDTGESENDTIVSGIHNFSWLGPADRQVFEKEIARRGGLRPSLMRRYTFCRRRYAEEFGNFPEFIYECEQPPQVIETREEKSKRLRTLKFFDMGFDLRIKRLKEDLDKIQDTEMDPISKANALDSNEREILRVAAQWEAGRKRWLKPELDTTAEQDRPPAHQHKVFFEHRR